MKVTFLNKLLFLISLIIISRAYSASAQNLVPNPGFETIASCPAGLGQLVLATPWDPLNVTADLFNTCYVNGNPVGCSDVGVPFNFGGKASPHGGNGYAGMIVKSSGNVREYVSIALTSPLQVGYPYQVQFYVRKATLSRYAIKQIGAGLSVGALIQTGNTNISITPDIESGVMLTDTTSWTLISGIYVAPAGVDHITLGNFRDETNTNYLDYGNLSPCGLLGLGYYYIDDISVTLINEQLNITGDTIICTGQSTTLTATANVSTFWSESSSPGVPIGTNPSLTVTPSVTTTYLLNGVNKVDSVTVHVLPPPSVNLGADTTVCENAGFYLAATNPNSTYFWSSGETRDTIYPMVTDTFWVRVNNGGCTRSDTVVVVILTNPPVHLGYDPLTGQPDTIFCLNDYDTLRLDAGNGTSYLWYPTGDTTQFFTVKKAGLYAVTVNHTNGCTTTDTLIVREICPPRIFIPRAFTPNGDLINDVFSVQGTDIYDIEIQIYTRWGQQIFNSHASVNGWNGIIESKPAPQGLYIYRVVYHYYNESGTSVTDEKTGSVALIR